MANLVVESISKKIAGRQIDRAIEHIHGVFETQSGDITPQQSERLDNLKADFAKLLCELVTQNL